MYLFKIICSERKFQAKSAQKVFLIQENTKESKTTNGEINRIEMVGWGGEVNGLTLMEWPTTSIILLYTACGLYGMISSILSNGLY